MLVFKARPRRDPAQRVDLTESQKRIMRLLNTAMNEVRREIIRDEGKLLDAMEHLSLDKIVNMVTDEPWLEMQRELQEELLGELNDAGKRVKLPAIQKASIGYSFDATRPEAAAWANVEGGKLVSEIISSQRDVIKDYASRANMGEFTPREVARGLRDVVGLTTQQSGWVRNFRDNEINRIMATGKTFDQAFTASEKATDRYHNKIHKYRTETIARTEILRASNEGRRQAWDQGVDEGFIDPDTTLKEWSTELDGRECEICAPLDGTQVKFNEEFPEGDPPIHPNCRCDVLLVEAPDSIPSDISSLTDEELDAEINSLIDGSAESLGNQTNNPKFESMPYQLNANAGKVDIPEGAGFDTGVGYVNQYPSRAQMQGLSIPQESLELARPRIAQDFAKQAAQDVNILMPSNKLNALLKDGRMKNGFEVKSSRTFVSRKKYLAERDHYERLRLGVPIDISPQNRPIYGTFGKLSGADRAEYNYGEVNVVLNPSVKGRTTMSAGDSLDGHAVPISAEKVLSGTGNFDEYSNAAERTYFRRIETPVDSGSLVSDYWEAQVHGGVSVKDIQRIEITKSGYDSLASGAKKTLEKSGIKVVIREG